MTTKIENTKLIVRLRDNINTLIIEELTNLSKEELLNIDKLTESNDVISKLQNIRDNFTKLIGDLGK